MWKQETAAIPPVSHKRTQRPAAPWVLRRLLKIDYGAIEPEVRGFSLAVPQCAERIRQIGKAFLDGYHCALQTADVGQMTAELDSMPNELRGFSYEGAGMGVALLDSLSPWRRKRFAEFLGSEAGDKHAYMLHVGMGWAYARLPGSPERAARRGDCLDAWLALDGYGFHEGFFHHPRYLGSPKRPRHLSRYGKRVFDQGLGRSLWFVFGSDALRIAGTIAQFDAARHSDLWAGVGLACAYAGGCDADNIVQLADHSGAFRPELAQGASFGAKARHRGGNLNKHTELASGIICGSTATEAAQLTDEVLATVDQSGGGRSYEAWRQGIKRHYEKQFCHVQR